MSTFIFISMCLCTFMIWRYIERTRTKWHIEYLIKSNHHKCFFRLNVLLKLLFSFSSHFQFTFATFLLFAAFYSSSFIPLHHSQIFLSFSFLFLIINIYREIRQKEIYKMIIDTNPLYINKFFRTVSKFQEWIY